MATLSHPALVRRRMCLRGIVQGVGFRPFVYNLAQTFGIRGFVLNSSSGLTIEAEGGPLSVEEFLDAIRSHPPPLARIEGMIAADLEPVGDQIFEIRESEAQPGEFVLVSPDVATCSACLHDISAPENRRFGSPYTNCTN